MQSVLLLNSLDYPATTNAAVRSLTACSEASGDQEVDRSSKWGGHRPAQEVSRVRAWMSASARESRGRWWLAGPSVTRELPSPLKWLARPPRCPNRSWCETAVQGVAGGSSALTDQWAAKGSSFKNGTPRD